MNYSSISFNGNKILKELDLDVQVRLPFLGSYTVNKLRAYAQEDVRKWMQQNFTTPGAPVSWTLGGVQTRPKYQKAQMWYEVFLADDATKGNAAADYLSPQIPGNPSQVYFTRFQRRAQRLPGNHPYFFPLTDSEGTALNANGRMRASQYTQVLYGLGGVVIEDMRRGKRNENRYKTLGKYVYVPVVGSDIAERNKYRRFGRGKIPPPGIYKVQNKGYLEKHGMRHGTADLRVFGIARNIPTVAQKFNFQNVVQESVNRNFAAAFDAAVQYERSTRK